MLRKDTPMQPECDGRYWVGQECGNVRVQERVVQGRKIARSSMDVWGHLIPCSDSPLIVLSLTGVAGDRGTLTGFWVLFASQREKNNTLLNKGKDNTPPNNNTMVQMHSAADSPNKQLRKQTIN